MLSNRPHIHETSMLMKGLWLVGVYSMAAYVRGTVFLLSQTSGFGTTFAERVPGSAMIVMPMLLAFGANSLYKGKYNYIMMQLLMATLYAHMGISKASDQEFRGLVGQTLQSYEWIHTLVFVIDSIIFLTYPFPHVVTDFRIRKIWHGLYMFVIVTYYGLFHVLVYDKTRFLTANLVEWSHVFLFTMCHIFMHPHFSSEELK